jgi:hypothetical protein
MNERIKELAEQAGYLPDMFGIGHWDMPECQKFAELIVRECADLFVDRRYMVLNPLEPFAYERVRVLKEHDKDTVKKIKQHFGVEE